MGSLRSLVRKGRRFEPTWRYLFNLGPTVSYRFGSARLQGEAARVLADLNRDGVATTSVDQLLGERGCFDELSKAFAVLSRSQAESLAIARATANSQGFNKKGFIHEYLGHRPILDDHDVFARFALNPFILRIANAYLGMYARLRYFNIWHTFSTAIPARQSQLWHRDREDHYIVKVFLYLSDVDRGAGPFTYAPGTHGKGRVFRTPVCFDEGGVKRSSDESMAEVVPREHWIECVGPRGTMVFADTHGYHKGGLARDKDRVMYTCMFTSPASESEEFLRRSPNIGQSNNAERAFALAPSRGGFWLSIR
jgi:hypothetical protein